jgi:hypothetical protein
MCPAHWLLAADFLAGLKSAYFKQEDKGIQHPCDENPNA